MSIILNREKLLEQNAKLREQALDILEAGLEAVDTEKILRRKISVKDGVLNIDGYFLNLKSYERIFFVGIGKCAFLGARIISEFLGDYLTEGAVIDVRSVEDAKALSGRVKYFAGTHPLPSEQNIEATKKVLEMVKDLNEKDLVLTLISGGGSALFELPVSRFNLDNIIEKTKELTARGADIYELNKMRKEMSQVKGGKFALACAPAEVVSIIFSDVLGNDISTIASGPTVVEDESGVRVKNILLCSNIDALEVMESKAQELGFEATIETDRFSGDAIELGRKLAERELKPRSCILMGGETTVKILNEFGQGGRNQTMALSALNSIKPDLALVCAASDGFDNTNYAGAIADLEFLEKAQKLGLSLEEFLQKNDSYNFWKNVGGGISTGRLESNVADLVIMLSK